MDPLYIVYRRSVIVELLTLFSVIILSHILFLYIFFIRVYCVRGAFVL